jgi:hypothetical protein
MATMRRGKIGCGVAKYIMCGVAKNVKLDPNLNQ